MMSIAIEGIEVHAYHGVTPGEKESGQTFLLDAEMELEERMAATDDLSSTVDYAAVAQRLAGIATSNRFDLIETLARAALDYLLSLEGVRRARVTVRKPEAPLGVRAAGVAVTAEGGSAGQAGGAGQ